MAQKSYATFNQLTDAGYLGAGATLTSYQTTLQRMLENASEQMDHFCYRHFDTWEGIMYFDGTGNLFAPNEDILSISEIALDMDGSQDWATTLDSDEYFMYPLSGANSYPKLYLKMSHLSSVGAFASGIKSGIKITGVFGHGDGYSATPYHDSGAVVNTGGITNSATTHALASGKGALFSAGNTIRIDNEQFYITNVSTDTLTFQTPRGRNGTTAAAHLAAATIYIYDYPGPVTEATLLLATGWWKQRENPATYMSGDQMTGTYTITRDMEKIIVKRLDHHIKRKLV
jgi:hypothetical protein